jgi:CRISPR/Cas system-associated endonuclease Cas3-HD
MSYTTKIEQMVARLLAMQEEIHASQERTIAKVYACLEEIQAWRKETTACQEATEAGRSGE